MTFPGILTTPSFDLSRLSEADLYDHLRCLWERARPRLFHACNEPETAFRPEPGRVQLMGVRGLSTDPGVGPGVPTGLQWDDLMLVLWREGDHKRVAPFVASLEYGSWPLTAEVSLLHQGLHRYHVGFHGDANVHLSLADMPDSYIGGRRYRCLEPYRSEPNPPGANDPSTDDQRVPAWEETGGPHDFTYTGEDTVLSSGTNVHYGYDGGTPGSVSVACQIVRGWHEYREFIRLCESDPVIFQHGDNEVAAAEEHTDERPLVYGMFLGKYFAPRAFLPVDLGHGHALTQEALDAAFAHVESGEGSFPFGSNTSWHGGVHLLAAAGAPVRACAPGTVVAARLAPEDPERFPFGSPNFVLLRHELDWGGGPVVWFSLYLHLQYVDLADANEVERLAWLRPRRDPQPLSAELQALLDAIQEARSAARSGCTQRIAKTYPSGRTVWLSSSRPGLLEDCEEHAHQRGMHAWQLGGGVVVSEFSSLEEEVAAARGDPDDALVAALAGGQAVDLASLGSAALQVEALDPIGFVGELIPDPNHPSARSALVHWEVFSDTRFQLGTEWDFAEDPDGDMEIEHDIRTEQGRSPLAAIDITPDQLLTQEEVTAFYQSAESYWTRRFAFRFGNEWNRDLDAYLELLLRHGVDISGLKEMLEPYMWWSQLLGSPHLPFSSTVWHYHPLGFLSSLLDWNVSDLREMWHEEGLDEGGADDGTSALILHTLELEGVCFNTNSAVFLPEGGVSGLAAIAASLSFARDNPGKSLLVAGHTDTSGDDLGNQLLSVDRAGNVAALLRGDVAAFARSALSRHVVADWQAILGWIAHDTGWTCDPGPADGAVGSGTRTALANFRASFPGATGSNPDAPEQADWEAFASCFEDHLALQVGDLVSARASLTLVEPQGVGCGESWPAEAVGMDSYACAANRRVELLFFDGSELPALDCHTGGGCDPTACTLYNPDKGPRYACTPISSGLGDRIV